MTHNFLRNFSTTFGNSTIYAGIQIRLLAFWDKTDNKETLVIATHGFVKKVDNVPGNEIKRAVRIKNKYFNNKLAKK